jgi:hypothetical protein
VITSRHSALDRLVSDVVERHPACGMAADLLRLHERDPAATEDLEALLLAGDRHIAERLERVVGVPGTPLFTSVASALRDVGFRRVHASSLVATTVNELSELCTSLDPLRFWRYATAVGALASLSATMDGSMVDEAFPAGFFHAIGRLVLDQHASASFARVEHLVREERLPLLRAESAVLGFNEFELGSALALHWGFPGWLVESIAEGVRAPEEVSRERRGLATLVVRARLAAQTRGFGTEFEPVELPPAGARWLVEPMLTALDRFGGTEWLEERVRAALRVALLEDA